MAQDQTGKIAIIAHSHPDLTKGGAEVSAYALYQGLRAMGRDVIFVASCLEDDLHRVERRAGEFLIPREDQLYDHLYHVAPGPAAGQLRALLVAEGVRIVNFHHFLFWGLNAFKALRDLDMRVYLTLHEYLAICHHHGQMVTRPQKNLCRKASRIACQTCFPELSGEEFDLRRHVFMEAFDEIDGFISPSHFLKQRFVDWGLEADRIEVIENGLLGLADKQATADPRKDPEGRSFTIGYFGQITPFKGMGVILETLERIEQDQTRDTPPDRPPFRVRVHGNLIGQEPDFVERFETLDRESPHLQVTGPYANAEVLSLMRACDYVIMPSQWWENSPVVIQEAYAAGCPVIASDLGGLAEKVQDGVTGLLFRMGDPDALRQVLEAACTPEIWNKLSAGTPKPTSQVDMAISYVAMLFNK